MGADATSHVDDVDTVLGYIGAVSSGLDMLGLATREGWEIASSAVEASSWIATVRSDYQGGPERRAIDRALRESAEVYAHLVTAAAGRMPSIASSARAIESEDHLAVKQLETYRSRLRSLGSYDAATARSQLAAIIPEPLASRIATDESSMADRLRSRLSSMCSEASSSRTCPAGPEITGNVQEKGNAMDEKPRNDKIYAHVKVYPSDVRITKKVFENEDGTKRTSAFVHCPKGMEVLGASLEGYEIRTTLADFQVEAIREGKPTSLGFDAEKPVVAFKGFDDQYNMIEPMEFNAWDFCSAMKAVVGPREAARENYVRINIPSADVHVFEQTSRAGNIYQKAAAKLPRGTIVEGHDASGRCAFFFMSKYNAEDLSAGRDTIKFSVKRDEVFDLVADRDSGEPAIKATGSVLAAAVREAIERAGEPRAGEGEPERGANLAELESAARATTEALDNPPFDDGASR